MFYGWGKLASLDTELPSWACWISWVFSVISTSLELPKFREIFFYISVRPGDQEWFQETHGNSVRVGRSAWQAVGLGEGTVIPKTGVTVWVCIRFEKRDTKEKLRLNCGVTAELCHSALARSECDDWPVHTQTGYTLKPWHRVDQARQPGKAVGQQKKFIIVYFQHNTYNNCFLACDVLKRERAEDNAYVDSFHSDYSSIKAPTDTFQR